MSLLYAPAAHGNLRIRLVRSDHAGPARTFERWRLMKLNPDQRAAPAQELSDAAERCAALDPAIGGEMYLIDAASAPELKPATGGFTGRDRFIAPQARAKCT